MNVLFYIDPHTLRQNPLGYWPITSRLYKTLYHQHCKTPKEYNFRLLVTKHPQPNQPFIATLPEKVNRDLLNFNCPWDDNAIAQWEQLMRGEGLIAELYYDILFYLMKKYSVDVFIYWGSNHTVKKFADSFNRYSFAMELGPTRKPFFESAYFDLLGVNGDAYSTGLNINDFPGCDIASLFHELQFEYDFYSAVHKPIQSKSSKAIYNDGPTVLLPLQLDDDSNCILHSEYNGMEEVVKAIVPKLVVSNYTVFIKPHPAAHPSLNRDDARKMNVQAHQRCEQFIREEYSASGKAVWLDDVNKEDYLSLLTKMDAVVTVNSSVAFEALLLGKTSVALGKAPYNISNALPTVDNLIQYDVDANEYEETAGKIANIMMNYYLYPIEILDDLSVMTQALKRGIKMTDHYRLGGPEALSSFVRNNPVGLVNAMDNSRQKEIKGHKTIHSRDNYVPNSFCKDGIEGLLNDSCPIPGNYDLIKASCTLPFESVLDVGFGRGSASIAYALTGKKVTGITLGQHCINLTKSHFDILGIEAVNSSLLKYDSQHNFDAIWISHCLEHSNTPGECLLKCRTLLKDGGWLFVVVPPYKSKVVRGHLSVGWNIGLLMYNLLCCGFNIREGHFIQHGYNICGFVQKDTELGFVLPMRDRTDLLVAEIMCNKSAAEEYWPDEIIEIMDESCNFDGQIDRVNWTGTLEDAMNLPLQPKVNKRKIDSILELGIVPTST